MGRKEAGFDSAKAGPAAVFGLGLGLGLGTAVPGLSGRALMEGMGLAKPLGTLSRNIPRRPWTFAWTVLLMALGMLLGFAALVFPAREAWANFPLGMLLLMSGLILGTLPGTFAGDGKRRGFADYAYALLALALGAGLAFLFALMFAHTAAGAFAPGMSPSMWGILAVVAFLGAASIVLPGFSGLTLVFILGYWTPLTDLMVGLLQGQNIAFFFGTAAYVLVLLFVFAVAFSYALAFLPVRFSTALSWLGCGFSLSLVAALFVTYSGEWFPQYPATGDSDLIQYLMAAAGAIAGLGLSLAVSMATMARKGLIKPDTARNAAGKPQGPDDFYEPVYDSRSGLTIRSRSQQPVSRQPPKPGEARRSDGKPVDLGKLLKGEDDSKSRTSAATGSAKAPAEGKTEEEELNSLSDIFKGGRE